MKNVPDERDPNKVWYLHINGLHHSEYESLHDCQVAAFMLLVQGKEIHIQTRQQWLDTVDQYDLGFEKGYEAAKRESWNK